MQPQIIDAAAKKIAAALLDSDDTDAGSIFAETLSAMPAEAVGGVLQSIEQMRDALDEAMQLAASASNGMALDELPKPTGVPMLDVNEISKQIVIEKPATLSLLGEGMVASHARRKLESEYDRALLEFLSLYANRLRRWMEQSINALRNRFAAFADMYRVHLEGTPVSAFAEMSAVQTHLQILRDWQTVDQEPVVSRT
jgi:hypothetical protein